MVKIIFFILASFFYSFLYLVAEEKSAILSCNKFKLLTSLYNETDEERLNEYKICIEFNLNHPSIRAYP